MELPRHNPTDQHALTQEVGVDPRVGHNMDSKSTKKSRTTPRWRRGENRRTDPKENTKQQEDCVQWRHGDCHSLVYGPSPHQMYGSNYLPSLPHEIHQIPKMNKGHQRVKDHVPSFYQHSGGKRKTQS